MMMISLLYLLSLISLNSRAGEMECKVNSWTVELLNLIFISAIGGAARQSSSENKERPSQGSVKILQYISLLFFRIVIKISLVHK